jgi:hypothetical protein
LSEVSADINDDAADRPTWTPSADPLARIVFALLLIACFAAFFLTQRLKHTPTAVQRFERTLAFSPSAPPPRNLEQISFKLARAEEVTVAIIDSQGEEVATLVSDHLLARYKQFSLRWNGRRGGARRYGTLRTPHGRTVLVPINEGALAPPGEYRVRLSLREPGGAARTVLSPWSFTLEGR